MRLRKISTSDVVGSKGDLHTVEITLDSEQRIVASCSCPARGLCWHITHVLSESRVELSERIGAELSPEKHDAVFDLAAQWCENKRMQIQAEQNCTELKSAICQIVSFK
jgi:hypothetical protein